MFLIPTKHLCHMINLSQSLLQEEHEFIPLDIRYLRCLSAALAKVALRVFHGYPVHLCQLAYIDASFVSLLYFCVPL